jgi:hypothetical protein
MTYSNTINYGTINPLGALEREFTRDKTIFDTKWDVNDVIVRIVSIPIVMKPHGFLLTESPNLRNNYLITINSITHELKGISYTGFTITNKTTMEYHTYSYDEFQFQN